MRVDNVPKGLKLKKKIIGSLLFSDIAAASTMLALSRVREESPVKLKAY